MNKSRVDRIGLRLPKGVADRVTECDGSPLRPDRNGRDGLRGPWGCKRVGYACFGLLSAGLGS
jgi:hypothetical protein